MPKAQLTVILFRTSREGAKIEGGLIKQLWHDHPIRSGQKGLMVDGRYYVIISVKTIDKKRRKNPPFNFQGHQNLRFIKIIWVK